MYIYALVLFILVLCLVFTSPIIVLKMIESMEEGAERRLRVKTGMYLPPCRISRRARRVLVPQKVFVHLGFEDLRWHPCTKIEFLNPITGERRAVDYEEELPPRLIELATERAILTLKLSCLGDAALTEKIVAAEQTAAAALRQYRDELKDCKKGLKAHNARIARAFRLLEQ